MLSVQLARLPMRWQPVQVLLGVLMALECQPLKASPTWLYLPSGLVGTFCQT